MAIIEFKNFYWKYEGKDDFTLKGINLKIEEGESVGIIGENEGGKTTLLRSINGLIPFSYRGIFKGSVSVAGKFVHKESISEISRVVGFVFSDPDSQFTSTNVFEELIFGLENLNLSIKEIEERINWIVEKLDLKEFLYRVPYELSGGQKQKVGIASVLVMKPRILILDEPTSMLDPIGKEEIFSVVKELKEEENMTLIIVEHNLEELFKIVERVIYIENGKIVYDLKKSEFLNVWDYEKETVNMPDISKIFSFIKKFKDGNFSIPFELEEAERIIKEI